MRLQLWAADSPGSFPGEVPGLPQPLLAGSSITYRARQPSTAQLQIWAPNSRSPFVLASTTLGVLGTSTLGGTATFRLLQRIEIVAPDSSDDRIFAGFITRIRRDPTVELADGRVKWSLDASDARWMFERDYNDQLTSAEVDAAYGSHSDKNVIRYTVDDSASTTTHFYTVGASDLDEHDAALDASYFTAWSKITLGRIIKDVVGSTGAVLYVTASASVEYTLETAATELWWSIENEDTLGTRSTRAAFIGHGWDGSSLATQTRVIANDVQQGTASGDVTTFGRVQLTKYDNEVANSTVGQDIADALLADREPRESFRFRFVHPDKSNPWDPVTSRGFITDLPQAHRRVTVNDAKAGLSDEVMYITESRLRQLSDESTEVVVTLGKPDIPIDVEVADLKAGLGRIQ